MGEVHVYMFSHNASIIFTAGMKTRLFPPPFLIFNILFLYLAEAFRNDHVAACSTAESSAAKKNEKGGYVPVPSSSKMTQCSSRVDWLSFF